MELPMPLERWVGIDVSKATLDIAILPEATAFQVPNDAVGWQRLLARVELATVQGIVLEATGRYHLGVTLALAGAGHPPAVITPQRSHAFLVSEGVRAKTDRSDAYLLARFGQQKQPAASPVDAENVRILKGSGRVPGQSDQEPGHGEEPPRRRQRARPGHP
jgi:transposase